MPLTESDQRHINLMREVISSYEENNYPLGNLIQDLRALFDCMQVVTDEWRRKFYPCWGEMEQVFSVALYRSEKLGEVPELYLNQRAREVDESIQGIKKLLNEMVLAS